MQVLPLVSAPAGRASLSHHTRRLPQSALAAIVVCSGGVLLLALHTLGAAVRSDPQLAGTSISVPHSWQDLRGSAAALRAIASRHPFLFVLVLALAYVCKQAFAIPGSILLNALAGCTLGSAVGIPLITLLSAAGATCGYMLSNEFGGEIIRRFQLEPRVAALRARVELARASHDDVSFFLSLVSLRLFPGTPHWLINMVAPHAGIPPGLFALSAGCGMLAYNGLTVRGGELIAVTEWEEVASPATLLALAGLALGVAAVGALVKGRSGGRRRGDKLRSSSSYDGVGDTARDSCEADGGMLPDPGTRSAVTLHSHGHDDDRGGLLRLRLPVADVEGRLERGEMDAGSARVTPRDPAHTIMLSLGQAGGFSSSSSGGASLLASPA